MLIRSSTSTGNVGGLGRASPQQPTCSNAQEPLPSHQPTTVLQTMTNATSVRSLPSIQLPVRVRVRVSNPNGQRTPTFCGGDDSGDGGTEKGVTPTCCRLYNPRWIASKQCCLHNPTIT